MSAIAIAYWLIFLGLLPVSYWGFRMLFENLALKLLPPHQILVECIDSDGNTIKSEKIDISDQAFYDAALPGIIKAANKNV